MLPPELVNILLDHLDLYSLVSLAQTCQSWNSAISEAEYRYMLLKSCPFFQLDNSNRLTWRDCATEYLRRNRLNSPKVDSSIIQQLEPNTNVTVVQDELLPKSFYALCKTQPATDMHKRVPLTHSDSGFSYEGTSWCLKEDSEGITTEEYQYHRYDLYDHQQITSRYGGGLWIPGGYGRRASVLAVRTNPKCIVTMVCYDYDEYHLLVKYNDSFGNELDIDFGKDSDDWLYSVGFCPSSSTSFDLFLVESCIFLYVQQPGHTGALLALNNGVMERVLFNEKYLLTSSPEMLCVFDGKIAMAGKHVMPEFMRYLFNRTPAHATNICQDPVYSNYVGLYNSAGSMTHLIDFASQSIVDITAFYYGSHQAGFLAIPGLVDGQLVIYRYSQQFLESLYGYKRQFDVRILMTEINYLVDAPEVIRLPQMTQTRVPARSRAAHRHKAYRRVVV